MSFVVSGSKPWLKSSRSAPIKTPGASTHVQTMRPQTDRQQYAQIMASNGQGISAVDRQFNQVNLHKITNNEFQRHATEHSQSYKIGPQNGYTGGNSIRGNSIVYETMSVPMNLYLRGDNMGYGSNTTRSMRTHNDVEKSSGRLSVIFKDSGVQSSSGLEFQLGDMDVLNQTLIDTGNDFCPARMSSKSDNASLLDNHKISSENDKIVLDHNSNVSSYIRTTSRQSGRSIDSGARSVCYGETNEERVTSVRERFLLHDKNRALQSQRGGHVDYSQKPSKTEVVHIARGPVSYRDMNASYRDLNARRKNTDQRTSSFRNKIEAALQAWDAGIKSLPAPLEKASSANYEQYEPMEAYGLIQLMPVGSKSLEDYVQQTSRNAPRQPKYFHKKPVNICQSRLLPIQRSVKRTNNLLLAPNVSSRVRSGILLGHQITAAQLRSTSTKRLFGKSIAGERLGDSFRRSNNYLTTSKLPDKKIQTTPALLIVGRSPRYSYPNLTKSFARDYRHAESKQKELNQQIVSKEERDRDFEQFPVISDVSWNVGPSAMGATNTFVPEAKNQSMEDVNLAVHFNSSRKYFCI